MARNNHTEAEIHKIETYSTVQRINKAKSWFLEKISRVNKSSSKLTKKRGRMYKLIESYRERRT